MVENIEKVSGLSMDIEGVNKEKLKSIFPECFVEGKLDIDKLLNLCGEYIDNDFEKYKFEWKGKSECYKIAGKRSTGTLRPCPKDSVNFDTTKNMYIEGDNLEVLKLLQTSYYRKVKMIYIDPPYNTGNDFVYEDDFKDPMAKYKEVTQQTTKSNPETMGRFHTNWLNMMYPRLRLAANLLRDDGVIFISIDDNEVTNLRKLCDEVFGEENFIAQIIHKNNSMKNQTKLIGVTTEYMFIYAKHRDILKEVVWRIVKKGAKDIEGKYRQLKEQGYNLQEIEKEIKEMYCRPKYSHLSRWNKVDNRGIFMDSDLSRANGYKDFTIINPQTGEKCPIPSRGWGKSKEELLRLQQEDLIWYGDGTTPPRMKSYMTNEDLSVPDNFWYFDSSIDTRWQKEIFGTVIFENPKPLEMLKQAITLHTKDNDIILDFFSGSATTAHAVMQLNAEDGGDRQFIMVQLPELCDEKSEAFKAGYKNICEIGKERIRRAGKKIHEQNEDVDTGFKVFKLDTSNLVKWDSTPTEDKDEIYQRMSLLKKTIKPDRNDLDVVYEVMLKLGIPLDYPIEEVSVNDKRAYSIGEDCLVLICLDYGKDGITADDVKLMCEDYTPAKIVASEQAFKDDVSLSNAHYILKDHNIEMKLL